MRPRVLPIELRRNDLLSTISGLQADKIGAASLSYLLDGLVREGRTSMAEILGPLAGQKRLAQRGATSGPMVIVMHLAVVCSDDPVRAVDELIVGGLRSRYALLLGQLLAQDMVGLCATIRVPELPAVTDVDVTTDVPTLILSGGLDAATPTFRSEVGAGSLPRASCSRTARTCSWARSTCARRRS